VSVRVQVNGAVSNLALDNRQFGPIAGETSLESPDFHRSTSRYEIRINGQASSVTILGEG
jgi:hypothetical protein